MGAIICMEKLVLRTNYKFKSDKKSIWDNYIFLQSTFTIHSDNNIQQYNTSLGWGGLSEGGGADANADKY